MVSKDTIVSFFKSYQQHFLEPIEAKYNHKLSDWNSVNCLLVASDKLRHMNID